MLSGTAAKRRRGWEDTELQEALAVEWIAASNPSKQARLLYKSGE
jgi:hypothetical protein